MDIDIGDDLKNSNELITYECVCFCYLQLILNSSYVNWSQCSHARIHLTYSLVLSDSGARTATYFTFATCHFPCHTLHVYPIPLIADH